MNPTHRVRVLTSDEVRQHRIEVAEYVQRHCIGVVWLAVILGSIVLAIFGPGILSGPWLVPVVLVVLLVLTHALTRPVRRIREGNAADLLVESSGSTSESTGASRN